MFNKSLFKKSFLLIIAINILSFLSYNSPTLNWLSFIFILITTALLTWRRLFWGVLILLGELMISSQGHLFDLWLGDFCFSLRMGLFIVVLTVALAQFLIPNAKFLTKSQYLISNIQYLIKKYKFYLLFALFIIFGIVNGLLNHNNINFIYQDANGYLFFLLLPVFIAGIADKQNKENKFTGYLVNLWAAAITWQFLIGISLLFLYGHLDIFWRNLIPLYAWFRDQRLIEVGLYRYNFYRIFMQSGLWTLIGFFVFLGLWLKRKSVTIDAKKIILWFLIVATALFFLYYQVNSSIYRGNLLPKIILIIFIFYLLLILLLIQQIKFPQLLPQLKVLRSIKQTFDLPSLLILFFIVNLLTISLSRTFWVTSLLGLLCFIVIYLLITRPNIKLISSQAIYFTSVIIISLTSIVLALTFPIGKTPGLKSLTSLSERATATHEPALSTRWILLPVLFNQIKSNFLGGQGFGAAITYKTNDPRYLAAHPDNPYYTTFAFEWGWLDIWYKMGILGLLTYLWLIASVLKRGWRIIRASSEAPPLAIGLFFGVMALVIVHVFTPFLNHPLGIGYLLLADTLFRDNKL